MTKYLLPYLATAAAFIVIDLIWLGWVARPYYVSKMGALLLDKPNLIVAFAFYALFGIGIVFFAVIPSVKSDSLAMALGYGALFGFFAYATYDLTNLAVIRNWSVELALVDIVWGTVLTGIAALTGAWVGRWMG